MFVQGFKPICNKESKVLILGDYPGPASLEARASTGVEAYYASENNCFWEIFAPLEKGGPGLKTGAPMQTRRTYLRSRGIALWDIIQQCDTDFPIDKFNRAIIYNDLLGKIKSSMPGVEYIIFNGKQVRRDFTSDDPYLKELLSAYSGKFFELPSTNNMCRTWSGTDHYPARKKSVTTLAAKEAKIKLWQDIINSLSCKQIP